MNNTDYEKLYHESNKKAEYIEKLYHIALKRLQYKGACPYESNCVDGKECSECVDEDIRREAERKEGLNVQDN